MSASLMQQKADLAYIERKREEARRVQRRARNRMRAIIETMETLSKLLRTHERAEAQAAKILTYADSDLLRERGKRQQAYYKAIETMKNKKVRRGMQVNELNACTIAD